jgi:hypothetical protein
LGVSSDRRIQVFGGLIALSLIATELWFAIAFVSVWCFFAAVLSLYIAAMLLRATTSRLQRMTGHQGGIWLAPDNLALKGTDDCGDVLVAGAGFEPATFRL